MKKSNAIIKCFVSLLGGAAVGYSLNNYFKNKVILKENKNMSKFKSYYYMLNRWLLLKNEGTKIEKYFLDHGYKEIAIYGMGEVGCRLYEELKDSSVVVKYAIDKNSNNAYADLEVYDLSENLAEVDLIVVTATFAFDEIEKELGDVVCYPVESLETIIFEL